MLLDIFQGEKCLFCKLLVPKIGLQRCPPPLEAYFVLLLNYSMNIIETLDQAIERGAALLPSFFSADEVSVLRHIVSDPYEQARLIPRFGELLSSVLAHLEFEQQCQQEVTDVDGIHSLVPHLWLSHAREPSDITNFREAHVDREALYGISALIPVDGPAAAFSFSQYPFILPFDQHEVESLVYGQTDVLLLRQKIRVARSAGSVVLEQTYHTAESSGERVLRVLDVLVPASTCIANR